MSNGNAINSKLDFIEAIQAKGDRALLEYTAELIYDHCETQKDFDKRIAFNTKMAWQNRYAIIGLVILLIALGILDASALGMIF